MRIVNLRRAGILAFAGMAQLVLAAPAQAAGSALMSSDLLAILQVLSSPNLCMAYIYDRNGNLTVKTNGTYGSSATWGSSTYGCFNWASP